MLRIICAARSRAEGPQEAPVRAVALLKGLLSVTCVATGLVTRNRTRALEAVIDSRPHACSTSRRKAPPKLGGSGP